MDRPALQMIVNTFRLLLLLSASRTTVSGFYSYSIDWASIPTLSNLDGGKNLTGNCICDLTSLVCDTGCCCDPDCAATITNITRTAGRCANEGPPDETLDYCIPSSSVKKVNLPAHGDFYDVVVQAADNRFFDQLLCVKSSRNPTLGDNYPDPDPGQLGDGASATVCPAQYTLPVKPSYYLYNTPVYISSSTTGAKVPLTLPYPAFSMDCNDQFVVGFMANLPISQKDFFSTCTRRLSGLQSMCTADGPLGVDQYINLKYFATPGSGLPDSVTSVSVMFEDKDTGFQVSIPAINATTYFAGDTCHGAIKQLTATVYTSWETSADNPGGLDQGQGTINRIDLIILITDVPVTDVALKQSIRVNFVNMTALDQTQARQVFSGNPGYLPGFALLAGQKVTNASDPANPPDKAAIQRYVNGLPLLSPSMDGSCDYGSTTAARYGYNTTAACSISLNATDLQELCSNSGSEPAGLLKLLLGDAYVAITDGSLYLGIWGNSNFTNVKQWIPVQVSNYPFNSLIYSASDNACSNLVVGFDLQILTGVAFSANNLQRKVLHANLCFKTATWDFPENVPTGQQRSFFMTSTVTYIAMNQTKVTGKTKPAPPLLAPLPEEIFYPFLTNAATSSLHWNPAGWLLSAVASGFALAVCSLLL